MSCEEDQLLTVGDVFDAEGSETAGPNMVADTASEEVDARREVDEAGSRKQRRRRRVDDNVRRRTETWTQAYILSEQQLDPELKEVSGWLAAGDRGTWDSVRGRSPALKAYWHQFKSLGLTKGIVVRLLEDDLDPSKQLLLPKSP